MTKTCTISLATGSCGAPAVTTFLDRRGKELHECVEHCIKGEHLLTCTLPLPLCATCASEFGLQA